MSHTEQTGKKLRFRFMAMSKLIGVIGFCFVLVVTIFSMYEMHISQDYSSLPQLIISVFAFASIYAGFYLTMAKAEHLEAERTRRELELQRLRKQKDANEEEIQEKRQQLNDIATKLIEMMGEQSSSLM